MVNLLHEMWSNNSLIPACYITGITAWLVLCNIHSTRNIGLVALFKQSHLCKRERKLLPRILNLCMLSIKNKINTKFVVFYCYRNLLVKIMKICSWKKEKQPSNRHRMRNVNSSCPFLVLSVLMKFQKKCRIDISLTISLHDFYSNVRTSLLAIRCIVFIL